MRGKIAALLVSLLAIGGVTLSGAAPAQAAACTGYLSFYDNSDGTTLLESTCASAFQRTLCYASAQFANNRTSYIRNTSGSMFFVYDSGNCSTVAGTIYPHSQGPMNGDWNNKISSFFKA